MTLLNNTASKPVFTGLVVQQTSDNPKEDDNAFFGPTCLEYPSVMQHNTTLYQDD